MKPLQSDLESQSVGNLMDNPGASLQVVGFGSDCGNSKGLRNQANALVTGLLFP